MQRPESQDLDEHSPLVSASGRDDHVAIDVASTSSTALEATEAGRRRPLINPFLSLNLLTTFILLLPVVMAYALGFPMGARLSNFISEEWGYAIDSLLAQGAYYGTGGVISLTVALVVFTILACTNRCYGARDKTGQIVIKEGEVSRSAETNAEAGLLLAHQNQQSIASLYTRLGMQIQLNQYLLAMLYDILGQERNVQFDAGSTAEQQMLTMLAPMGELVKVSGGLYNNHSTLPQLRAAIDALQRSEGAHRDLYYGGSDEDDEEDSADAEHGRKTSTTTFPAQPYGKQTFAGWAEEIFSELGHAAERTDGETLSYEQRRQLVARDMVFGTDVGTVEGEFAKENSTANLDERLKVFLQTQDAALARLETRGYPGLKRLFLHFVDMGASYNQIAALSTLYQAVDARTPTYGQHFGSIQDETNVEGALLVLARILNVDGQLTALFGENLATIFPTKYEEITRSHEATLNQ